LKEYLRGQPFNKALYFGLYPKIKVLAPSLFSPVLRFPKRYSHIPVEQKLREEMIYYKD